MAIHPNPDRDVNYMREVWGTTSLIADYHSNPKSQMLREISNDDKTPKKRDSKSENELVEVDADIQKISDWISD
jgi:hypothetical protein